MTEMGPEPKDIMAAHHHQEGMLHTLRHRGNTPADLESRLTAERELKVLLKRLLAIAGLLYLAHAVGLF